MNAFLRSIKNFFFITCNNGKSWRRKHNWRYKKIFLDQAKQLNYPAVKDITNIFRREKVTKKIKDGMPRNIKNLMEHEEEENYYKIVRVRNFVTFIEISWIYSNVAHCQSKNILIKLYHI